MLPSGRCKGYKGSVRALRGIGFRDSADFKLALGDLKRFREVFEFFRV